MKNKYVFTAVLLLLLTAIGAGIIHMETAADKDAAGTENELNIVTSFYPMYIAAKNVVGDIEGVTLENLTEPQTGCLHDYQLTPQDMVLLSTADVFVINGGGIESFIEDVAADYPDLTIVTASDGITFLGTEMEEDAHLHEGDDHAHDGDDHAHDGDDHAHEDDAHDTEEVVHYHGDGHDHGDVNAHVWMDVYRYMQEVDTIAEALTEADEEHVEAYRNNAEVYCEKLQALCAQLETLKGKAEGKKIVIFHDAFAYFADAFGLEIAAVIDMDEDTSLSANRVSQIVTLVKDLDIDMLFTEEQYGTKIADAVSRETDAKVYVLDSLVTGEEDADSYLCGMTKNLETLEEAFGEEE